MTLELLRKQVVALVVLALGTTSCATPDDDNSATDDGNTPANVAADNVSNTRPNTGSQNPSNQDPTGTEQEVFELLLSRAVELEGAGQLDEAKAAAFTALRLRDNDPRAQELLARIQQKLGQEVGDPLPSLEDERQLAQVRQERNRISVDTDLETAEQARQNGDYAQALQALRNAQLAIDSTVNIDWEGRDTRVADLRATVEAERNQSEDAARQAALIDIRQKLTDEENRRAEARREEVDRQVADATRAFKLERYRLAQDFAGKALAVDATDPRAAELYNMATKALRANKRTNYQQQVATRILELELAEQRVRVPDFDIFSVDDRVWRRANARNVGPRLAPSSPEDEALLAELETKELNGIAFTEDEEFADILSRVRTIGELTIIVTPSAQEVIDSEGPTLTLDINAPLKLANFFNLLVGTSEDLSWSVDQGVVKIQSSEEAGGDTYLDAKDVRDLVFAKTQFKAPIIENIPDGSDGFDGGSRTGSEEDEKKQFVELDVLIENIQGATDAAYWEEAGSIEAQESGFLFVNANKDMHGQVDRLLEDLRRFATTVITLESRFLTIEDNFLQEIGVDIRGLGGSGTPGTVASLDDVTNGLDDNASRGFDNGGTGDPAANPSSGFFYNDGLDGDLRGRTENFFSDPLGNALSNTGGLTTAVSFLDDLEIQLILEAVEKKERITELNSQLVTVQNNEQGYVAVINQTTYVRDFEVEVAQAAFIADPRTDVIQDGVVLEVKPTVLYDRKKVLLQLTPTVANLSLPIPTFSTSLAGTTTPVTLQLPQLEVSSFATTVVVPDGGSVLIGGLREITTRERRAQTPILGDIPILGFFFKQEGISDEKRSLMVMVRATITDVRRAVGLDD